MLMKELLNWLEQVIPESAHSFCSMILGFIVFLFCLGLVIAVIKIGFRVLLKAGLPFIAVPELYYFITDGMAWKENNYNTWKTVFIVLWIVFGSLVVLLWLSYISSVIRWLRKKTEPIRRKFELKHPSKADIEFEQDCKKQIEKIRQEHAGENGRIVCQNGVWGFVPSN